MNDKTDNNSQKTNNETRYLDELNWDIKPERDLWPDIHSNIRFAGKPKRPVEFDHEASLTITGSRQARRLWMPMSMAACMMLALSAFIMSCLLYTSPSPRDQRGSRMPSSA